MSSRFEITYDAGTAPTADEVAAIAAVLLAATPPQARGVVPPVADSRWRRAGRAYGADRTR